MKKFIFNQVRAEWKSNIWIVVEMIIVSVILWFLLDFYYVAGHNLLQPLGADISHTYCIGVSELRQDSPVYDSTASVSESMLEICDKLGRLPEVEAAAISFAAAPYSASFNGGRLQFDTIKARNVSFRKIYTPGFFKVFKITGANGETPEQLEEIFADRKHLIAASNIYDEEESGHTAADFIGMRPETKIVSMFTLGSLVVPPKRTRFYDKDDYPALYVPGDVEDIDYYYDISLRVKPEAEKGFEEKLWSIAESELNVGNLTLSMVEPYSEIRKETDSASVQVMALFGVAALFLLINIFLGLLGTFWFRLQQRVHEMSLQKALGFTRGQIFCNQLSEGLLLLAVATVPAVIIDINLALIPVNEALKGQTLSFVRMLAAAGGTFVLMAVVIMIGIAIPAFRACKIQPAEGLHQE